MLQGNTNSKGLSVHTLKGFLEITIKPSRLAIFEGNNSLITLTTLFKKLFLYPSESQPHFQLIFVVNVTLENSPSCSYFHIYQHKVVCESLSCF